MKFKDLAVGQKFKFKDNDTIMQKLRCPNKPDGCFCLCVTDGPQVHKAGDLFISVHGDGIYHEQEMLTEIDGVWQ